LERILESTGDAIACASANPATNESLVLTYAEQASELDPVLFVLELFFEGGLEVLFGLVELFFL
jgi:hypothetical protein